METAGGGNSAPQGESACQYGMRLARKVETKAVLESGTGIKYD